MNNAFAAATAELKRQCKMLHPGAASDYYIPNFMGPYLAYGTSSNRIVLHVDRGVVLGNSPLEVYFNDALYNLFSGLPSVYANKTGDLNYRIQIETNWYNPVKVSQITTGGGNSVTITMQQVYEESCSTAMWRPVSSIVFATSLLPIIPSQTSATRQLGDKVA